MSITNPNRVVKVSQLNYFKGKLDALFQTQAITAITGMTASTVEGALAELLGKIQALPSAIVPKGTKQFSGLVPLTDLVAANVGFMWNISDGFTTTSDFAEGSGHVIPAGANVYVANTGTAAEPVYKYDIFQGMYDLSGYATKVSGATSGNFAGLDGNGNLTDSGSKASDFATAAQGTKADSAVQDVLLQIGTGTPVSIVSNNEATLVVAEGATNGSIAFGGTDVPVHGLGTAAYKAEGYFEPAITYAENTDIDEMFS